MKTQNKLLQIFSFIFLSSIIIFSLRTLINGTAFYADAKWYFEILQSVTFSHNLNLPGGLANFQPPGVIAFWIYPYWLTKTLVDALQIQSSGFEVYFQLIVGLTNIFIFFAGLYITHFLVAQKFGSKIAIFSTLTLFLSTNLLFYAAFEPINSHLASFFIASCFIY